MPEVDPAWLDGVKRVGVTAGASAPEYLVEELTAWLRQHGATTVSELAGEDEKIQFKLPDMDV